MIGYLKGRILDSTPERVLLDVGGVGYEVHISLTTFGELQRSAAAEAGAPVGLFVHTHVRAEALELFGFHSEHERRLFAMLINVGGIGPRLARVILSGMPPAELVSALGAGDLARLGTIPGVGKKTAERMVVELKDKMLELAAELEIPSAPAVSRGDELVQALVNLGYKEKAAGRAVAQVRKDHPDAPIEELLPEALKLLSRA